jgi:hypothetical protein
LGDVFKKLQQQAASLHQPVPKIVDEILRKELEDFVKNRGLSAQFVKQAEAREYRETLIHRQHRTAVRPEESKKFSEQLFTSQHGS